MSQLLEPKEAADVEQNKMEINCNGHASSSPESKTSSGEQETKQSAKELEDQQNANQPENNTETHDTLCNKEEEDEICKASCEEPESAVQQLPSSLSSDDAVERNEGETESKKMEDMDTQGKTKQENEEDSQSGSYRINIVFRHFWQFYTYLSTLILADRSFVILLLEMI